MVITSKFGQFIDYTQHKTKDSALIDTKVNRVRADNKKQLDDYKYYKELDKLEHGDYYSDFVV